MSAEVVHVVAGAVAQRAVLAVAGDRAVDEPGVLLAQALVADAEAVEHAGAEGLQHDVVLARQAQEDLAPAVGLQVDADGATCCGSAPGTAPLAAESSAPSYFGGAQRT